MAYRPYHPSSPGGEMKVTEEISVFKIYPIPKHAKIDKNKLLVRG